MDYHEAADFLFDLRRFAVRPGTESTAALRAALGDPGDDLPFVQIAGSNGKGSTAKMVESILRESGLSVGLYTSPHLSSLDERIQVDGRPITASAITEFIERTKPWLVDRAANGEPLTFFEVVTMMGVWYFDREDVDVAVLEVGLGGEYDATSVVDPVASCVTTVTLEHTDVLGDTIQEIATTKAKVTPEGETPLVTGATGEAREAIRAEAGDLLTVGTGDGEAADCTVSYEGRVNHTEASARIDLPAVDRGPWAPLDADTLDVRLPLLGEHQALNAGIATTLAGQVVGSFDDTDAVDFDAETIGRGLRNAHWPGRFEVMGEEPLVVLDGAHNPEATATLAETLSTFEYDDLHLVFGAMGDKSYVEMAETLPVPDSVVTCRPDHHRAEDPDVLARVFEKTGADDVTAGSSVDEAFDTARERTDPEDCLLVCGSLFAVGEARTTLTRRAVPKQVDDTETARDVLSNAHVTDCETDTESERAVHRVVSMQVEGRQATILDRELRSLGGSCGTSGVTAAGELHDVVLMGTLAQFRQLTATLDSQPFGLSGIADEIRRQVGLINDTGGGADSHQYPWDERTAVMGILNVTPDSFHDGGDFFDREAAIDGAKALVEEGADIIDIGGESTRPGADPVGVDEEIDRVVPVIEAVSDLDVQISVDTRKAAVAEAALDAGADILNDVAGLEDPAMRFLAADREVPVIVMHSIDTPVVPDRDVDYEDVVEDVIRSLNERVLLAEKAGIPRERIIVDPGLGFGKTAAESFELLGRLDEFRALGCPILIGHSHKSMFDHVDPTDDRLEATVAATALAAGRGADIVRVHDVAENRTAVGVQEATDDPRSE
ncbi:dihydropteroate synthase [Halohasta litorea]|uniref:Probable bifunctional folylpolyglutamate synthase/dihydropteroate synthase n=1 Tax=Halohasta litorea TaxID=869891 RepID=A0ABD6DAU0_9EURY|nr:dihydropteroate synthase [Halohasta litorea]